MSTDHPFHKSVKSKHEKGPTGQIFPCSMTNNPIECRYWIQAYSVDDHVTSGEKTMYYLERDFTDMVYDLHVES